MRKIWFYAKILLTIGVVFGALTLFDVKPFLVQYSLLDVTKRAEISKAFIEAIAIVVAGLWTYELYIKNRYDHPYPKIEHRIANYKLANGIVYLSVTIIVINEGKTKLDLGRGKIYVRQVLPLTGEIKNLINETKKKGDVELIKNGKIHELFRDAGQRVGWMWLGYRDWKEQLRDSLKELEPGQKRETQFDFLIMNDEVEVIQLISYFNFGKSHWELATLHSLKESETKVTA